MKGQNAAPDSCYRLVFWNVENLFDIWDDTCRNDDAFTPTGDNHWSRSRYQRKLANIGKTIVALGVDNAPLVVGMAEVENDKVLRDLCRGTMLRRLDYDYVHFDSPDRRGIDNALLFRRGLFTPYSSKALCVSDTSQGFFTRDILLVEGLTAEGDTLIVLVNHFPSKLGGAESDRRRRAVADRLAATMDTLAASHPFAAIVVMGDFNAAPREREICHSIGSNALYTNLMESVDRSRGSYKYQDHWQCIDQIIVSNNAIDGVCPLRVVQREGQIFEAPFLLVDDDKFLGKKVFRTYLGVKYLGGYSDHLPVYVDVRKRHP